MEESTVRSASGRVLKLFDRKLPPPVSTVEPELTVQRSARVTMNRAFVEALGFPEAIEFAFSEEEQLIGVRAADPGSSTSFRIRPQGNGSSFQTSGESFVKGYGIPHERATRYKAQLDGDLLIVNLAEGGVDVSGRLGSGRAGE